MQLDLYQEIRNRFITFFAKSGHKQYHSSSLIPSNDPTLLFTNSGMVQFKDFFLGFEEPKHNRITTVQKCLRAGGKHNDLENVGYTTRHHTFFEMMGNFSFRDYFKAEAIEYAWLFLTRELEIDKNKLLITVYHTDDEAWNLWHKITGFEDDKIIRIDGSDNFWSMGDIGPCGPCSEIYYEYNSNAKDKKNGHNIINEDKYVEIWNLVFMQMHQNENELLPLSRPSIDTGMGLERIMSVLEGSMDNYKISIFLSLISEIRSIYHDEDPKNDVVYRVVADHMRAIVFLIADGILPSNDGRGYVLRRIMRRAMRYLHKVDSKNSKMCKIVPVVQSLMSSYYPEILKAQDLVISAIETEEQNFKITLENGIQLLNNEIANLGSGKVFSGEVAFKLYDTYGFPLDLTLDALRRENLTLNIQAFDDAMNEQKTKARAAWKCDNSFADDAIWREVKKLHDASKFVGYEKLSISSIVVAIIDKNGNIVESIENDVGWIVLDSTTFYPESGGQVCDIGKFILRNGIVIDVVCVRKFAGTVIAHKIDVLKCSIAVGDEVKLMVDSSTRLSCSRHHSVTHLLHFALQQILPYEVSQKGSYINADGLHFDFNCNQSIKIDQLNMIEMLVNDFIIANTAVNVKFISKHAEEVKSAMALFDEKYDDVVRVVDIGDSKELCIGTHVRRTGDIGFFKIIKEMSIGSGVRRIEAVAGLSALKFIQNKDIITLEKINELTHASQNKCSQLVKKIENLHEHILKNALTKCDDALCYFYFEDFPTNIARTTCLSMQKFIKCNLIVFISLGSKGKYTWIVARNHRSNIDCILLAKKIIDRTKGSMPKGGYAQDFITFGSSELLAKDVILDLLK